MDTPPLAETDAPVELEVDLDAVAAALDGVDAALRRLDEGTYGTCEVCIAPLADEQLAADPVARRCPDHAAAPASITSAPAGDQAPADPPPQQQPPTITPG